ncbi:MAG: type I-E CRISPR-associated protein Cas6/Cse3/CasE [Lentisphaeria bacterium]
MLLYRLLLNPRCKEARRDLSNPYELHSTLCRAFSEPSVKCPEGTFLWRLEPEASQEEYPKILVQSEKEPVWERIGIQNWMVQLPDLGLDLIERLKLSELTVGQKFRFRLRANPSRIREKKRQGLLRNEDQEQWLVRQGAAHGFKVPMLTSFEMNDLEDSQRPDIRISQERLLRGVRHDGRSICVFSVLYDGILTVTDPIAFQKTLASGIGHGKTMGLGLLSVVPLR